MGGGGCGFQGRRLHSAKRNFEGNLAEVHFVCIYVDGKADVCLCAAFTCLNVCMCEQEGVIYHFVRRFFYSDSDNACCWKKSAGY